jgi:chromosome segregation ATPase
LKKQAEAASPTTQPDSKDGEKSLADRISSLKADALSELELKHTRELEDLQATIKEKEDKVVAMESELQAANAQALSVEGEFASFKSDSDAKLSSIQSELEELKKTSAELEPLKEDIQILQDQLENEKKTSAEAQKSVENLQAELEESRQIVASTKSAADASLDTHSKLTNELESLKASHGEQVKQKDEDLLQIKSTVETLQNDIAKLEQDKADGDGLVGQLQNEIKTLQQAVEDVQKEKKTKTEAFTQEIEALRSDLDSNANKVREAVDALSGAQAESANLQQTVEKLQDSLRAAEQHKSDTQKLIENLQDNEKAHVASLSDASREIATLGDSVAHLEARLKSTSTSVGDKDKELAEAKKAVEVVRKELSSLQESSETAQKEYEAKLAKLATDHQSAVALGDDHLARNKTLTSELSALKDQCVALEKSQAALEASHAEALSGSSKNHEDALSELKKSIDDLTQEKAKADAQFQKLTSQHEKALKEADTLKSKHADELKSVASNHASALATAKDDIARSHANEVEKLQTNFQEQLDKTAKSHAEELANLQDALQQQLKVAQSKHSDSAEQIESIKATHQKELESIKATHAAALGDATASHAKTLHQALESAATAHSEALKTAKASVTAEADKVKALDSEVAALQKTHIELQSTHKESLAALQAKHDELKGKHDEANKNHAVMQKEHKEAIAEAQSQHDKKVESITREHAAAVERVQKEAEAGGSSLQKEVDELKRELAAALDQANSTNASLEKLQKELDEAKKAEEEVAEKWVEIAQIKSDLNEEKTRSAALNKRLESVVTDLAGSESQLKEVEAKLKQAKEQYAEKSKSLETITALSIEETDVSPSSLASSPNASICTAGTKETALDGPNSGLGVSRWAPSGGSSSLDALADVERVGGAAGMADSSSGADESTDADSLLSTLMDSSAEGEGMSVDGTVGPPFLLPASFARRLVFLLRFGWGLGSSSWPCPFLTRLPLLCHHCYHHGSFQLNLRQYAVLRNLFADFCFVL